MLSHFELSTLAKDNFQFYRTPTVVRIVLSVYIGMTVVTTLLLKLCGMTWFDSVCHAMSSCGSCGFSTKDTSIAWFDSAWVEIVLMLAMCTSGIHFGLIFATLTRQRNNIFRSEITRTYFSVIGVSAVLIAISLWVADIYPNILVAFRKALFHTVSLISTSGFATDDCNTWTSFAILILIFISFVCACAGSTSGGLKIDRLLLAAKMLRNRLSSQQHPNAIIRTKIDGIPQDKEMLNGVMVYIVAYMILILLGAFVNTMFGADLLTGFSSSVACVSNVGPAFGEVGTMDNYSLMPSVSKFNLTMLMLFGRLEIFGLIQLFFIRWWR